MKNPSVSPPDISTEVKSVSMVLVICVAVFGKVTPLVDIEFDPIVGSVDPTFTLATFTVTFPESAAGEAAVPALAIMCQPVIVQPNGTNTYPTSDVVSEVPVAKSPHDQPRVRTDEGELIFM